MYVKKRVVEMLNKIKKRTYNKSFKIYRKLQYFKIYFSHTLKSL